MKSLLEVTRDELGDWMSEHGQPAYRADQVWQWIWDKQVVSVDEMTNLPKALRGQLASWRPVMTSSVVEARETADGTVKALLALADGERIEAVMIPTADRGTACVSTQVGCAMGCGFCASGLEGVVRDLTCREILEQVRRLGRRSGRRISHVVFMGMGEPLANFDATVEAVQALIDPDRMGLSARHITVSTVGLPGRIRDLAALELPITLAISLHAPSDKLRQELIPAARGASIDEIIEAARVFFASRGREVTLEYVLLGGVNDSPTQADALADIAHRLRCNVNLIRYNPVASLGFERPLKQDVETFARRLDRRGVNVQIRRSRGVEADAACGQLRRRREDLASRPGTRDHRQET